VFLDYFNRPKWVRKYKIQQGTNEPINLNKLVEVIHNNYLFKFRPLKKIQIFGFSPDGESGVDQPMAHF
jgi:hypothetical protein